MVQLIVAGFAMQSTQKLWMAYFILALFPLSIVFVALLEAAGLD